METCPTCIAHEGCGYCHSTLMCIEGDANGPLDGLPCPDWFLEVDDCPAIPQCTNMTDCNTCAAANECAWCSSQDKCLTIEDTYSANCRSTVFAAPCPDSFIGGKLRLCKNLCRLFYHSNFYSQSRAG